MPVAVPVSQLERGMILASNIVNKYSVLLPHNHTLSESDISSLRRRFPDKLVQVIDPLLDELVEFDDNSGDYKVSLEVRRNVAAVSNRVSHAVRANATLTPDNIAGMQRTIEDMMRHMQDNPVTMAIIEQSGDWSSYLQEHSSNVFYLSMVIGNTIRNHIKRERERLSAAKTISDAMNLIPMAVAAIIHDVGMVPIEQLYRKEQSLTKEEVALVKAHPMTGAKMLPVNIDPMVKLVVRCHHENQNGSGYPEGISGDRITVFARIIRVADAYSAAISRTTFKKGKSSVLALYEMLHGQYKRFYDPVVLKVFARIIQPFPIGAKLKLESGRVAVVTKHNLKNSFKPQVLVAFDEKGEHLAEGQFEGPFFLDERDDIKIVSFENEDISYINKVQEESLPDLAEVLEHECSEMLDLVYP